MGKINRITSVIKRYYTRMITLVASIILIPGNTAYARFTGVTDIKTMDEAKNKTVEMFQDIYKIIVTLAVIGAIVAIAYIKGKGGASNVSQDALRNAPEENKKVRNVLVSLVIVVLAPPIVYWILGYYGYIG